MVRASPAAAPSRRATLRPEAAIGGAVLLAAAVAALSIGVGANLLNPVEVLQGLAGRGAEATAVVQGGRIPRTVLGLAVGGALGLAGAVMQSVTRNALADPGLLGVNAGASAAVVTAISVLGLTQPIGYIWFAFLGAAAASVLVYALGSIGGSAAPLRMALAGTALTAALSAYITGRILTDAQAYFRFRYWDIGALTGRTLSDVGPILWVLPIGGVLALALARALDTIALGEDVGTALGAHPGRTRALSAIAVTLLCGAATAAVGPIGFVGLAAPHVARLLVGPRHRRLLPMSMLLGAVMLLGADVVGRVIAWPQEVGAGLTCAAIGAPVLILLVRRRRNLLL